MYGFEMSTNQNGQAVLYGPLTIFVTTWADFCISQGIMIHRSSVMSFSRACLIARYILQLLGVIGRPAAYHRILVFKWLAICAFEKPRIAKLCSTKYERSGPDNKVGRIVVDKVIGIIAIQGHAYGESVNNYQLLGWTKVDQAFTGTHIFFGFHQTTESKAWKILGSEGIFPGGPSHCSTGDRGERYGLLLMQRPYICICEAY